MLPLPLYLLSFVLVFSRGEGARPVPPARAARRRRRRWWWPAAWSCSAYTKPLLLIGGLYLAAFFVGRASPATASWPPTARRRGQLTQFYAFVSLGGALGGVFNVVIAPSIFNSLTELPIALVLTAFLLPFRTGRWTDQISAAARPAAAAAASRGATAALLFAVGDGEALRWVVLVAAGLACLALLPQPAALRPRARRWRWWRSGRANVDDAARDLPGAQLLRRQPGRVAAGRLRARPQERRRSSTAPSSCSTRARRPPTTTAPGRWGSCSTTCPTARVATRRAAVVGLGAGTMACLSRPGEPLDLLRDRPGRGPARARQRRCSPTCATARAASTCSSATAACSLERRARRRVRPDRARRVQLGLPIPVHLLTREAIDVYAHKLSPNGVIAFHISNPHLDLGPVLARQRGRPATTETTVAATRQVRRAGWRWRAARRTSVASRATSAGSAARATPAPAPGRTTTRT